MSRVVRVLTFLAIPVASVRLESHICAKSSTPKPRGSKELGDGVGFHPAIETDT
jgi:hypothetical protein